LTCTDDVQNSVVGDERNAAFVELLTQHQRKLFNYIYSLIPNVTDSDDLLQETNIVLWNKRQEYKLGTKFNAWACRIAYFKVQNFLRTNNHNHVYFDEELLSKISNFMIDHSEMHTVYSMLLIKCLENLSGASRQLLKLRYDGNCSIQEVAKKMGRSAAGIYNNLSQIRHKLWECIQHALMEDGSL
jgi:RNA polymerase sigma-70 factor (ECF subfamily)